MQVSFEMNGNFTSRVRGNEFEVVVQNLPEASLRKVFEYGLQRILNDACANAKTDEEAKDMAAKRWDNLVNGVLRASPNREGNPVQREAKRIAEGIISKHKVYIGWLQENGLKASSKEGKAKLAELVADMAKKENILAQAKANVEANKGLEIELEI